MVTSKFESLRMEDKESILEYDSRLRQLSNEAHSLGDLMPNERLVNKVLRSLPERFNVKVCAIEESKDTSKINLDELMSSLRTFEMNLDLQRKDKGNTIALEASTESHDEILQISKEVNESDLGEESISLITKKFGDYLKTMREKKIIGQTSVLPNITTSAKAQKFTPVKGQFRTRNELQIQSTARNLDSVKCRECSGFGHYANECANRLRRNKGMTVTLSDEESDDDQESNESEKHISLSAVIKEKCLMQSQSFGCCHSQSETQEVDDDEITLESVQKMYEELYEDWIKRNKVNAILSKENTELKSQVSRLEVILSKKDLELCKFKEELGDATQILAKLNSSSSKLDSLLMIGKNDKAGLGYTNHQFEIGESSNTERKPTVFVKGSAEISNTSHTEKGIWYFDSGCSRHMTGSKDHLIDYVELHNGHVTYGGGAKGIIAGKGTLNVDGLPSTRSADNCYQLGEDLMCNHSKVSELNLWHQKLGHANFKTLKNISKYDAVRDLTGKTIEDDIYGLLNVSETLPNPDVASDVVTPESTPALAESNDEPGEYTVNDDDVTNEGFDILSKIQKNHPSSQIIGEAFGGMQTRRKRR
ncbi:uncharacterized protein [Primulina eburnea]|uniref:uncharacterized protein n=1 Tax=Primulina eburnea TaxID=1245227 RepID=UPI003C6CA052